MANYFWRWLPPVLWAMLLAFLSLMPSGQTNLSFLGIPHIDKVGHFGMYAILAFLVIYALDGTSVLSKTNRLWLVFLVVSLVGATFEYGQLITSAGRSFDVWDIIANCLGALMGSLTGNLWFGKGDKKV